VGTINIAWWNLENCFDHEGATRDPILKATLKNELKGWTAAIRDRKLAQLGSVVEMMFDGQGPDLLGVCEVESEAVLARLAANIHLPGRDYQVVSHASKDARGIDISFLVDRKVLSAAKTGHQVVLKRTATRDIFWVELTLKPDGPSFVAIANHWPARSEGQYASEPFRMLTGETLAYVISHMLDLDSHRRIVAMGDFNDEPFCRSMQEYLLGTRDPGRVRYSQSGHMLNLMWPLLSGNDPGTYLFESDWNMLDQFLVSKEMIFKSGALYAEPESVSIFRPKVMVAPGGRPRRFGRPARSNLDLDGYSDHFPINLRLRLA
jgi:endonuclease/exonuclease/phosphatase family metal-dependent hydrolase